MAHAEICPVCGGSGLVWVDCGMRNWPGAKSHETCTRQPTIYQD